MKYGHWVYSYKRPNGQKINCYMQCAVSNSGSNVNVTFEETGASGEGNAGDAGGRFDWTMKLQRRPNPHPETAWTTVGTRTGYVSLSSPSNRTFTNVKSGYQMRVLIEVAGQANHSVVFVH